MKLFLIDLMQYILQLKYLILGNHIENQDVMNGLHLGNKKLTNLKNHKPH